MNAFRTISILTALVALTILLSGCGKDPFGATSRERVRSDAQVRIAEQDARARIGVAEQNARARIETANVWASVLPTLGILLVVGVGLGLYIHYNAQVTIARIQHEPRPALAAPTAYDLLEMYADTRGLHVLQNQDGTIILVSKITGEIVERRRLLTGAVHGTYGG